VWYFTILFKGMRNNIFRFFQEVSSFSEFYCYTVSVTTSSCFSLTIALKQQSQHGMQDTNGLTKSGSIYTIRHIWMWVLNLPSSNFISNKSFVFMCHSNSSNQRKQKAGRHAMHIGQRIGTQRIQGDTRKSGHQSKNERGQKQRHIDLFYWEFW
jgi:hypothetical protein